MDRKRSIFFCGVLCVICLWISSAAWFRVAMARIFEKAGHINAAITLYEKVIRKEDVSRRPVSKKLIADICMDLARLYDAEGMRNRAIGYYLRALSLSPRGYRTVPVRLATARDYTTLGAMCLEAGFIDAAQWFFTKAQALFPDDTDIPKYIAINNRIVAHESPSLIF